jgi:hypothetical protein
MDRGRPESRVVFVQLPIRESVRQSLQGRQSGGISSKSSIIRHTRVFGGLEEPLAVTSVLVPQ